LNKIDLIEEDLREDKINAVAADLSAEGILVETLGGEVQVEAISALNGDNVSKLIEKVLLEAEVNDSLWVPKIDESPAEAEVVDTAQEKGLGSTMVCVVRQSQLNIGDVFVMDGGGWGRIRALRTVSANSNAKVEDMKEAPIR